MRSSKTFPPEHVSEIIRMALSDHISFGDIETEYGISEKQVKLLMRTELKKGSYNTWSKRVREFSDRRTNYK